MYSTANQTVQREPMSISSITTNQDSKLPRFLTEPTTSNHRKKDAQTLPHYNFYQDISHHSRHQHHHLIRSPPTTPERDQYIHSPPSSPHSFDFSASSSQHGYHGEEEEEEGSSRPVTLQERRQRNKAASAKYRQKKNTQQHEMKSTILQLSERNGLLERQLREMRDENQKLRLDADKLRGKSVAKKLLRQWMDRQKNHHVMPHQFNTKQVGSLKSSYNNMEIDLLDDDDDDLASSSSSEI
ncbi:hypothetical protein MFLAVUS_001562 [Mucor flavus]|uniref:BZIP domain-containing protein n=1 Tax=Mucor flavus TaxID=439312 RepID=A0ABP9YMU3_9FUNG